MSRSNGRRTGRHWTMIVPTISDEYQMFEWALRQKYHSSFTLPSSFQPVRIAAMIATTIPKLIETQSPIFSTLRMSNFQVIIQGKAASTKSMMILYTTRDVSTRRTDDAHPCALTVAAFLEVISGFRIQAEIQTVVNIIAGLAADFAPLNDDLCDHVCVHRSNTEPKNIMVPALSKLNKSNSECGFGKRLADQSPARSNGDENVHPVIPRVGYISGRKFNSNQTVVDGKNELRWMLVVAWQTRSKH